MGRSLGNSLVNLELYDECYQALFDLRMAEIFDDGRGFSLLFEVVPLRFSWLEAIPVSSNRCRNIPCVKNPLAGPLVDAIVGNDLGEVGEWLIPTVC